jgi:hypothetical protein
MIRPVRRRVATVAVVLLVPLLGACGFGAQTDQVYQPAVGVNDHKGQVDVLGAVVASASEGLGTFVASLDNKNPRKAITLVDVKGSEGIEPHLVAPVKVEPGTLVNLADLGAVRVTGEGVKAGGFARLTLIFDTGQSSEVNAPIVAKVGIYAEIKPAIPSASPSATP